MKEWKKIGNEDAIRPLSRMAVECTYEDLPADVQDFSKVLLLDTIGCMIGGHSRHPIPLIAKHYQEMGGKPESYIPFFGGKVPAENAAMCMGPMTRAIDFAPIHDDAMHQTEHVLPPLLASLGMFDKVNGKDFLTAFVVGVETLLRIGIGYNGNRGIEMGRSNGHYIFGGVGAVGHLMGFDEITMANAHGIARQMTQPHDMAAYHPVTHMIKVHQGFIAQDVITSCKFAKLGVTGPIVDVVEGPKGLLGMAAWETFPEKICADMGKYWHFMEIQMKAYCGCKFEHMAAYGAETLMKQNNLTPDDIERIHVRECLLSAGVSGGTLEEKLHPADIYQRQFSIPFMVATIMYDKHLFPDSFTDEAAARPEVQAMMRKVTFETDESLAPWDDVVTVYTKDGRKFEMLSSGSMLKGSMTNRYTREELIFKFKSMAKYSVMPFSDEVLTTIAENVLDLENSEDVLNDVYMHLIPKE